MFYSESVFRSPHYLVPLPHHCSFIKKKRQCTERVPGVIPEDDTWTAPLKTKVAPRDSSAKHNIEAVYFLRQRNEGAPVLFVGVLWPMFFSLLRTDPCGIRSLFHVVAAFLLCSHNNPVCSFGTERMETGLPWAAAIRAIPAQCRCHHLGLQKEAPDRRNHERIWDRRLCWEHQGEEGLDGRSKRLIVVVTTMRRFAHS